MRRTPDETREALIDALIELLDDRGPDAIPVREIAERAGVNHGLVHRYFGGKDELVRAAVARVSTRIHAGVPEKPGMSAHTFAFLRERPHLARVLARACLDGRSAWLAGARPDEERYRAILGPVQRSLERMGVPGVDAATLNALAISALFGWFVFRPLFDEGGWELAEDADEQLARMLVLIDVLVSAG